MAPPAPKTRARQFALVRVDGRAYTYDEIAKRMDATKATATQRVARIRARKLEVTWERLGVKQEQ